MLMIGCVVDAIALLVAVDRVYPGPMLLVHTHVRRFVHVVGGAACRVCRMLLVCHDWRAIGRFVVYFRLVHACCFR